jgi:hypothetical protein
MQLTTSAPHAALNRMQLSNACSTQPHAALKRMQHSTACSTKTHATDDERTALKRMQLRIVPQILHAATHTKKKRTASPDAT